MSLPVKWNYQDEAEDRANDEPEDVAPNESEITPPPGLSLDGPAQDKDVTLVPLGESDVEQVAPTDPEPAVSEQCKTEPNIHPPQRGRKLSRPIQRSRQNSLTNWSVSAPSMKYSARC